jgi:hypothetical protein
MIAPSYKSCSCGGTKTSKAVRKEPPHRYYHNNFFAKVFFFTESSPSPLLPQHQQSIHLSFHYLSLLIFDLFKHLSKSTFYHLYCLHLLLMYSHPFVQIFIGHRRPSTFSLRKKTPLINLLTPRRKSFDLRRIRLSFAAPNFTSRHAQPTLHIKG